MNTRWMKIVIYVTLFAMLFTTIIMSIGLLFQ